MPTDLLRGVARDLVASTEALAALGAVLRLRVSRSESDPATEAALASVVEALGLAEAIESADPDDLAQELAFIDAFVRQSADLLGDPVRSPGWSYTDLAVLRSQGRASATFPEALARVADDELPGLRERLEAPDSEFLDVGVGVAGLSIAMCERWPALSALGVDPWQPALAIARQDVEAAGLAARIELRLDRAESLEERGRFDLAWLPGPFISPPILGSAVVRTAAALRPGGWLILAQYRGDGALGEALSRLRAIRSGGSALGREAAEAALREAGLGAVHTLPDATWPPALLTVGRLPPA